MHSTLILRFNARTSISWSAVTPWSGSAIKVDRKGKDTTYIPHPHVCVTGGVQPDLLGALADEAGRRDGFIERILWSYPETQPGEWTDDTVPADLKEAVYQLFKRLRAEGEVTYRLDADAKVAWTLWYNENQKATHGATDYLAGIYAKLPNQVARLALILQCLGDPTMVRGPVITRLTLEGAFTLADYFVAHGNRVLSRIAPSTSATPPPLRQRVFRALDSHGDWMALAALHDQLGGHVRSDDLQSVLAGLQTDGAAESTTCPTGERGRPAVQWRLTRAREENE